MRVKDKVAVVTGGASGIGLALCTRFAREGAQVVLSDLDQDACDRQAAPIGAFPVAADVGREDDIKHLVATTIERFGRIDLFVSDAGIAIDGGIDTPTDKWHQIINVNLTSDTVSYTVTKHAALGLREWLAATCDDQGIGVSVLCPAAVRTPIPAGRYDTPDGRDAITTDELAEMVMKGLAEELPPRRE